jgi:hypothetical protein
MPTPGFLHNRTQVYDVISGAVGTVAFTPASGTLGVYEGTIASSTFGTIVGGLLIKARALSVFDNVSIARFSEDTGSIIGFSIFNFGKALGSMVGSFLGTVIADTNHILLRAYVVSTIAATGATGTLMGVTQPTIGNAIVGTIVFLESGM